VKSKRKIRSIKKENSANQKAWTLGIYEEFPKDADGVIYVRQSSLVQMQKNIHSYEMQTDKFLEHFRNMGCTGHIETIADDEALSGTLDIHNRPGMTRMIKMIESGKVGWIAAVAVNRFTRDPWLITPGVLMKTCYNHDVWIATLRMHFNLKDPYCQRVFMLEAEEAARHLEWMKLVLGGARATASSNGYYDGRWLVPGYIVDRTDPLRKKYIVYEPHATVVKWLFRRFLELDGNFYELGREVDKMPFLFPMFESWVDPKNISRFAGSRKRGGSLIKEGPYQGNYKPSIHGIRSILCNPVYIGWWLPLDGGVVENNHEALVDEAVFTYAHKRLSSHDLNGERQKPLRVTRNGETKGVLKKVLRDCNDEPMYTRYVTNEYNTYYTSLSGNSLSRSYEYSVLVERLDKVFLEKLFERLEALKKLDDWEDRIEERLTTKKAAREYKENLMRKSITEAQEKRSAIMGMLSDKELPLTKQMRIDYVNECAGLEKKIKELQESLDAADEEDGEDEEVTLYQIHSLLPNIAEKWDKLSFDVRLRFVGAVVQMAVLEDVAPSWLKLEIHWKDAIGNFADVGYIRRTSCNRTSWSQEEEARLREIYPKEDAAVILQALPERSWKSIMTRAERMGIKRDRGRKPNSFNVNTEVSLSSSQKDREFEEAEGVSPSVPGPQWRLTSRSLRLTRRRSRRVQSREHALASALARQPA